jgi:endogenous inhibitor of DNA gyrase (YacG/DUF329 family)
MSAPRPTVKCPTCRKAIQWSSDNPYRPFCTRRCRLIDLGEWLNESHRIAGEPAPPVAEDSDGGY